MNYPKPLQIGDHVAVISPATPTHPDKVKLAEKALIQMGLVPVMYPSCFAYHGHLSGTDQMRAKDINDAFVDPNIKGIICLKGGSGSTRLLNMLDYERIKLNPKIFIGFSDITALHLALAQKCDLVTFHGPMAASEVFIDQHSDHYQDPYTLNSFKINLFTEGFKGLLHNPIDQPFITYHPGVCTGPIIGGNLSLLTATLGSPYEIQTKGKILFIEEIDEPVYKIDKMLTSLVLSGKISDCEGIILGTFSGCRREPKESYGGQDLSLDEVISEVLIPSGKPIIGNLRAGHNYPQPTLAFGVPVKLNATQGQIEYL